MLFALTMVPLIVGAGMATDFARAQILRSSLQTIADSSALAGASELNQNSVSAVSQSTAATIAANYFKQSKALLLDNGVVGPADVTVTANTVKVSVKVTLKNTLMSLFVSDAPMSVSATAQGPGYALKFTPGKGLTGSSDASDENDIYYYTVPASGSGRPPIDATGSAYKLLFSNNPTKNLNSSVTLAVGTNDLVGFGMYNITGGKSPYNPATSTNAYGGGNNSVHAFYSSIAAPSMDAGQTADVLKLKGYPTQPIYTASDALNKCAKTNINLTTIAHVSSQTDPCGLGGYPCVTKVGTGLFQNNLLVNNQCSNSTNAILSCLQLYETPTTFSWGDMGGHPKDDFDDDDLDYTVQCVPNTTGTASSGQPAAVILIQ